MTTFDFESAAVGTEVLICFDDNFSTEANAFETYDDFVEMCRECFENCDPDNAVLTKAVKHASGLWRCKYHSRFGLDSEHWYTIADAVTVRAADAPVETIEAPDIPEECRTSAMCPNCGSEKDIVDGSGRVLVLDCGCRILCKRNEASE